VDGLVDGLQQVAQPWLRKRVETLLIKLYFRLHVL
jgi:hypothetical protein